MSMHPWSSLTRKFKLFLQLSGQSPSGCLLTLINCCWSCPMILIVFVALLVWITVELELLLLLLLSRVLLARDCCLWCSAGTTISPAPPPPALWYATSAWDKIPYWIVDPSELMKFLLEEEGAPCRTLLGRSFIMACYLTAGRPSLFFWWRKEDGGCFVDAEFEAAALM